MHREAEAGLAAAAARPTGRTRARRRLHVAAIIANVVLFAVGLWFEAHPRDRSDRWTAAGVAAVALANSAALSVPTRGRRGERAVLRLRRVALILNGLLLLSASVIVALASARGLPYAALHAVLLVPPLLTTLALVRLPRG